MKEGIYKDYGIKTGDKINNWTILGDLKVMGNKSNRGIFVLCRCNCKHKTEKYIRNSYLYNNRTNGCIRCGNKKYNKYDLSGEYGIGYTFKGEEFYFDLEDYDKIKEYCWHMHWDTHNGYLRTRIDISKEGKNIYEFMHRLVMDFKPSKKIVDHINNKTFDNRKINLRITSRSMNSTNVKNRKDSKYIRGVTFSKNEKKYKACINFETTKIHLGTFELLDDAIRARLNKEFELLGGLSPQKSLFEKYGIGDKNE